MVNYGGGGGAWGGPTADRAGPGGIPRSATKGHEQKPVGCGATKGHEQKPVGCGVRARALVLVGEITGLLFAARRCISTLGASE